MGFNDPTPATPVGGNTGTTIGAQRLIVFKEAARIWGAVLPSNVDDQDQLELRGPRLQRELGRPRLGRRHDRPRELRGRAPRRTPGTTRPQADKLAGAPLGTNPASITRAVQQRARQDGLPDRHVLLPRPRQQPRLEHQPPHGRSSTSSATASGSRRPPTRAASSSGRARTSSPACSTGSSSTRRPARPGTRWRRTPNASPSATNTGNLVWTGPNAPTYAKCLQRTPAGPLRRGARRVRREPTPWDGGLRGAGSRPSP